MDYLEEIYGKKQNFPVVDRKLRLHSDNSLIQGNNFSGVREFILSTIGDEKALYVDLADFRATELSPESLKSFIKQNSVELLVVENFSTLFQEPLAKKNIFISEERVVLEKFENYTLDTLSFEEYIGAIKHKEDVEEIFDDYLKHGTILELASYEEEQKIARAQELVQLAFPTPTTFEIYKFITLKSGFTFSLFQAFNIIKESIKISKDIFYKTIEDLKAKRYIFTVDKLHQPKAAKKFYTNDFFLKQSFTTKKDLAKTLEQMTFLELIKNHEKIYYLDFIDFFITESNTAVITLPFCNYEKILVKVQAALKNSEIENIEIVTLNYEYEGEIFDTPVEALPFWQWALKF